jgi:hypothetical protein
MLPAIGTLIPGAVGPNAAIARSAAGARVAAAHGMKPL